VYIFRQVPVSDVRDAIELVQLRLFLPLVVLVFTVYFAGDALAHHLAFSWLAAPTRFFDVLLARAATYILAMLNFFAGQGGIGYWLVRTRKVSPGEATSSIVFVMFMELYLIFVLSSVGIVLMPEVRLSDFLRGTSEGTLVRLVFITLAVLTLQIVIWVRKPDGKLVRWLLFRGPFMVFDRVRLRHFALIFALKLLVYVFDLLGAWLALEAFGVDVPLVRILTYLPLIYLIGSIPITVLHLGTTQVAWVFFFRDLVPPATMIGFSLLWHFAFVAIYMLVGVACLPRVLEDLDRESPG
jgi:uncharacterized membrane protein YbhN (UPF0104 family)